VLLLGRRDTDGHLQPSVIGTSGVVALVVLALIETRTCLWFWSHLSETDIHLGMLQALPNDISH
jgi:hypothetical protein